MSIYNNDYSKCHEDNSIINGDYCKVYGNDCIINGDYCEVFKRASVVNGDYCKLYQGANVINGDYCKDGNGANLSVSARNNFSSSSSVVISNGDPPVQMVNKKITKWINGSNVGSNNQYHFHSTSSSSKKSNSKEDKHVKMIETLTGIKDEPEENEDKACIICLDNARVVAPQCNHFQFCGTCVLELVEKGGSCPTCRNKITSVSRIYS